MTWFQFERLLVRSWIWAIETRIHGDSREIESGRNVFNSMVESFDWFFLFRRCSQSKHFGLLNWREKDKWEEKNRRGFQCWREDWLRVDDIQGETFTHLKRYPYYRQSSLSVMKTLFHCVAFHSSRYFQIECVSVPWKEVFLLKWKKRWWQCKIR